MICQCTVKRLTKEKYMSLEQAKTFLVRLDEDEKVRASAQAAYTDELLKLAGKLGYTVSASDLKEAIAELSDVGGEISMAQLETVAGGLSVSGGSVSRISKPMYSDSVFR